MLNTSPDVSNTKESEIAVNFEKFLLNVVEGSKFPKLKKVLYGAVSKAVHFVKNIVIGKFEKPEARGIIDEIFIDIRTQNEQLTHISISVNRTKDKLIEKETYDLRNKVLRDGPFVTSRICSVEEIQLLQDDISDFLAKDSKEVNIYYDLISAYNLFEKKLQEKSVYTLFVDGEKLNALNVIKLSDGRIHLQHVHNPGGSISYTSSIFLKKIEKNKITIDNTEKFKKDFKFPNQDHTFIRVKGGRSIRYEPKLSVPVNEIDEIMNAAILGLLV